jgi:hypothetical protein
VSATIAGSCRTSIATAPALPRRRDWFASSRRRRAGGSGRTGALRPLGAASFPLAPGPCLATASAIRSPRRGALALQVAARGSGDLGEVPRSSVIACLGGACDCVRPLRTGCASVRLCVTPRADSCLARSQLVGPRSSSTRSRMRSATSRLARPEVAFVRPFDQRDLIGVAPIRPRRVEHDEIEPLLTASARALRVHAGLERESHHTWPRVRARRCRARMSDWGSARSCVALAALELLVRRARGDSRRPPPP